MSRLLLLVVLGTVLLAACTAAENHLERIEDLDLTNEVDGIAFPYVDARAGNCVVSQVHINIVTRVRDFKVDFLNMASIGQRIDPNQLVWQKIRDTFFSCMDAIVDRRVMGAPGGDAGEFLLALKVFEELTGYQLRQRHVSAYLKAFLEKTAKEAFFTHTTQVALQNLKTSCGVESLDVLNPPVSLVRTLWDQVILPENVGCRHLKYLLERPAEYGVRLELTQMLIRAFYMIMWNKEHPQFTTAASKLTFLVSDEPQPATEGTSGAPPTGTRGLVNVLTGPHCLSEGLAPTIAPKLDANSDSIYVTHYDAVQVLRRDLARFFTLLVRDHFSALNEVAMLSRMNVVGRHHLQKSVKYLTTSIPIYSVTFI
jgi:hypothetical protein